MQYLKSMIATITPESSAAYAMARGAIMYATHQGDITPQQALELQEECDEAFGL